MYAKNKAQSDCDVKVARDGNSLRISFPKRHTPLWELMDGKSLKGKPKYLYLGKAGFSPDNPDDCKRAAQIAIAMESDLDHPEWDKLFDRTLEKYGLAGLLGGKYAKLADVLQMPGTTTALPEITVGEMWEAYLEWKKSRVEKTTFMKHYARHYTNALKGKVWNNTTKKYDLISGLSVIDCTLDSPLLAEAIGNIKMYSIAKKNLLGSLSEAFVLAQSQGKTTLVDPFKSMVCDTVVDTRDKYKSTVDDNGESIKWWQLLDVKPLSGAESDKRAFTKDERDIIIKAFYESDRPSERHIAPMIEFLFLTGCRPGEAFALTWANIKFNHECIVFNKSYSSDIKENKVTKNNSIRMFKLTDRLADLLHSIKDTENTTQSNTRVFSNREGNVYNNGSHRGTWYGDKVTRDDTCYFYPGVVTRLAEDGVISQYLPPYHTRHTFITLMAWANKSNASALMLLAHACENSVATIIKHYLGVDKSVELVEP